MATTNGDGETDYTTWRLGRKTPRDGKIGICPKCGRKGAIRIATLERGTSRERRIMDVTHKIEPLFGGAMTRVTDNCLMRVDEHDQPIIPTARDK